MTVKASISLTDAQNSYARALVTEGRYSSLSAVLQRGLDLLRDDTEVKKAELAALRALLEERESGRFLTMEEGRAQTARMIARKKASLGLPG